jgi:hypothetical protein
VSELSDTVVIIAGFAGALAAVPATAVAYSVPAEGAVRVPRRWWLGGPANLALLAATAVAGASSALIASALGASVVLPAFCLVAVLGTALAIIDLRCRRLPHALTGLLWAAAITSFGVDAIITRDSGGLVRAAVAAATATGLFLLLALALPGQLGLGDVNLVGVLALTLGWIGSRTAVTGLVAGIVIQAVVGLAAMTVVRKARLQVAMGPALLIGWLLAASASSPL